MKYLNICLLLTLFNHSSGISKNDIPNPSTEFVKCGMTHPSNICDPNNYLTNNEKELLNKDIVDLIQSNVLQPCNDTSGYEMYLIIIDKTEYSFWDSQESKTKEYSIFLHNKFKLGNNKCGNGILALFSIQDRVTYISLGKGLKKHISGYLMENIIESIVYSMKSNLYYNGFHKMIKDMNYYMNSNYSKRIAYFTIAFYYFVATFIVSLFFMCIFGEIFRYAKFKWNKYNCQKKIDKLNSDKEDIEKGIYKTTSCPICIEEKKIQYTSCGHGFCKPCISKWKETSNNCPICRKFINNNSPDNNDIYRSELYYRLHSISNRFPRFISRYDVDDFACGRRSRFNRDFVNSVYTDSIINTMYQNTYSNSNNYRFFNNGNNQLSSHGAGGSW